MMPPNAQNIKGQVETEITTPSATNTAYKPAMSDDAIDNSLAEVAKTFHMRQFGNGSVNGNANFADASMLAATADDIAYVMDDGLTSLSGNDVVVDPTTGSGVTGGMPEIINISGSDSVLITFIGTGISYNGTNWAANTRMTHNVAQNLPYGTHILRLNRPSNFEIWIDGIKVRDAASGPGHTVGES